MRMLCKFAQKCIRWSQKSSVLGKKCFTHLRATSEVKSEGNKVKDHLTRTEGKFRQRMFIHVRVADITELSSTVRGLKLQTLEYQPDIEFKAGQWIDMVIPDVETVGGFSVCSSPLDFKKNGVIELAVKFSDHPPAHWIHKECQIGSHVSVRFGGDFLYDPSPNTGENLILIAGGVGINPIYSILRHRNELLQKHENKTTNSTTLMYCARTLDELIFKDEIQHIFDDLENSNFRFFVTQEDQENISKFHPNNLSYERITINSFEEVINTSKQNLICYICGPPGFIDSMAKILSNIGIPKQNIKFEKWW